MTKTTVPIWAITAIVATLAIITSVATWGTTQAQSLPTVAFPTINMTVDEPASSNDVAIFQVLVRMNQTSNSNVTVDYATTGVVARPGEDYRDVSGTLRFPAGTTEAHIRIPILGDDLNEGADRFEAGTDQSLRRQPGCCPGPDHHHRHRRESPRMDGPG